MKKIILASNSPRRQELLRGLDLEFIVDTGNTFQETMEPGMEPHMIPAAMALGKSRGFHRQLEDDEVLVTADTVVIVGKEVLGKPHTREEAINMLRMLSGRSHEVVTAVTIRSNAGEKSFSDTTIVHFEKMQDSEIEYYVDKYRPFDKAGAYGIQEWIGYALISSIEGSFYNVMGFPVHKVWKELPEFM